VARSFDPQVIWQAQTGPQAALVACPIFEVFFGGSRGGGKTEGSIGDWLDHSGTYGEHAIGVFFRRTRKQLEEVVARTEQIFPKLGAKYNKQESQWTMPGGARLKFRYIEQDKDAEEYQGHSYTRVYVEEVTNFPTPGPLNKLRATLRSATGVPVGMRLTGNPGGPGHNWVKKRYIDPDKRGWKVVPETFEYNGTTLTLERVYIPSRLTDNPLLVKNDPTYIARLHQSGSAQLVKAWLEGDWDIVDGAFFDCWDPARHVLMASEWKKRIPAHATRFRAFDWGSAKPFSCGWYVISDGRWGLPRDAMLKYREWYGSTGQPNVGLKMTADVVARGIVKLEDDEEIDYGAADPSIFVRNGGPSIAETMAGEACFWRKADNKRAAGWEELRRRLVGVNGHPMLYMLDSCQDTIRTLPVLQHDEKNPEDLDTDGEDHAADETRYAVMSRPWTEESESEPEPIRYPRGYGQMTIDELVAQRTKARLNRQQELFS
jgi:hypothetical protein